MAKTQPFLFKSWHNTQPGHEVVSKELEAAGVIVGPFFVFGFFSKPFQGINIG